MADQVDKGTGLQKVHQQRLLDKGKIEKLVDALRAILPTHPEVAEKDP